MKASYRLSYFLLILILIFVGCLPQHLTVPVERPAEIDLSNIETIAIHRFHGRYGVDLSEELTQQLIATQRFGIINRQHLDQLIREYNLAEMDGLIDQESAVKLGNLESIEAIIYGRVIQYDYDEDTIREKGTDEETGEVYYQYTRIGEAIVEVSFEIQELGTGLVLSSKRISRVASERTSEIDASPPPINATSVVRSARASVVRDFVRSIAPYKETVSVKLLTHRKIPELDRGIDQIRIEDWDKALEFFKQAADEHPENPKALYNLGIAYKYTYQFDKAEKYLKEAYMIRGNNFFDRLLGGNTYEHAIKHLRQMREDERKLQQQIGNEDFDEYVHESLDTAWVQRKLNELGYNCGAVDGIMGPKTRGCIEAYQESNGLSITGSLNQETTESLNELR